MRYFNLFVFDSNSFRFCQKADNGEFAFTSRKYYQQSNDHEGAYFKDSLLPALFVRSWLFIKKEGQAIYYAVVRDLKFYLNLKISEHKTSKRFRTAVHKKTIIERWN